MVLVVIGKRAEALLLLLAQAVQLLLQIFVNRLSELHLLLQLLALGFDHLVLLRQPHRAIGALYQVRSSTAGHLLQQLRFL